MPSPDLASAEFSQQFQRLRFLGPMGPADVPAHPERRGTAPPSFVRGLGPIGAVWTPEVDDFRSDFGGRSGPNALHLHPLFRVEFHTIQRSARVFAAVFKRL